MVVYHNSLRGLNTLDIENQIKINEQAAAEWATLYRLPNLSLLKLFQF